MAGRLKLRPLCVYGTDEIPQGAMPSYAIDRCIAKAVYTAALYAETPLLYVDASQGQCCPGGMVWMGFNEPHPKLKYFVTVGTPDFLGGMAEHLKATPELFEEQRKRAGKITPPGKYIVIGPCRVILRGIVSGQSSSSRIVSRLEICAAWHSSTARTHSL